MNRVLVTGATGCIGRALTKKLLELDIKVRAIVRNAHIAQSILGVHSGLELIQCELLDAAALLRAVESIDSIFHLAAKVHSKPRNRRECDEFFEVNVEGTRMLLDACEKASVKTFIFFSTIAVFGQQPAPLIESMKVVPITSYAKSKYEAEKLVFEWFSRTKAHVVVLRPSMVFGEGDRGNFSKMVKAIDKGWFVTFGHARKSVAYSGNIADIAIFAARNPQIRGQVLIASDPPSYTINEIARHVAIALGRSVRNFQLPVWPLRSLAIVLDKAHKLSGIKMPFGEDDISTLTSDTVCDTTKLHRDLGFQPHFCFFDGISRTIDWYRTGNKL